MRRTNLLRTKLSGLHGEALDQAYIHDMVADHKKDVAEFQQEAKSAHGPDLKRWASKTLPRLQEHLRCGANPDNRCED
jgi:putative membrane protein